LKPSDPNMFEAKLCPYKRQGKAGSSAQALIWEVLDDGELSWDLA